MPVTTSTSGGAAMGSPAGDEDEGEHEEALDD
jgi:hypothetical protein